MRCITGMQCSMRAYRIMSETYYKNPYSASGAGGRWHPRETRMMYAGSSASVTLLEIYASKAAPFPPSHGIWLCMR